MIRYTLLSIDYIIYIIFGLSIILYPFSVLGHSLYLIFHLLLFPVIIFQIMMRKDKCDYIFAIILICYIFAIFSALLVELFSGDFSILMIVKIFINFGSVLLFYLAKINVRYAFLIKMIWIQAISVFLVQILLYYNNSFDLMQFSAMLISGDKVSSELLYGIASPLEKYFLTKNISGMYFVCLYGLYLFLIDNNDHDVDWLLVAIFFVVILLFVSRQALLVFAVLNMLYIIKKTKYVKYLFLFIAPIALYFLVIQLFDFNSRADGATERILLWGYFYENYDNFIYTGLGLNNLNKLLDYSFGIDNFHMFFMNQIGVYGIIHFFCVSLFIVGLAIRLAKKNGFEWLFIAYILNISFQTYGYEFGNTFLFMIALSTIIDSPQRIKFFNSPKLTFRTITPHS